MNKYEDYKRKEAIRSTLGTLEHLGCQLETDNDGQIIVYTNLKLWRDAMNNPILIEVGEVK